VRNGHVGRVPCALFQRARRSLAKAEDLLWLVGIRYFGFSFGGGFRMERDMGRWSDGCLFLFFVMIVNGVGGMCADRLTKRGRSRRRRCTIGRVLLTSSGLFGG
jgi:hypothetical protein